MAADRRPAAATGRGVAFARAALAGNPSDGYGGAVLAVTIDALSATASARAAVTVAGRPPVVPSAELVTATVARFAAELEPAAATAAVDWETTIPRAVGLGGSSAIVIATLRALCELHGTAIEPLAIARLAHSIESDDLGIAAGLQDRVAQTHGPLTFMDFSTDPPRVRSLEVARLPPLLIAWRPAAAADSGTVHAPLRDRHRRGEPAVLRAIEALTGAAHDARSALERSDLPALRASVDASFDARRSMLELDRRHVEMIEAARAAGAAANYAGSGGAIVAVCDDERHRSVVARELRHIACRTLAVTAPRDLPDQPSVASASGTTRSAPAKRS